MSYTQKQHKKSNVEINNLFKNMEIIVKIIELKGGIL